MPRVQLDYVPVKYRKRANEIYQQAIIGLSMDAIMRFGPDLWRKSVAKAQELVDKSERDRNRPLPIKAEGRAMCCMSPGRHD